MDLRNVKTRDLLWWHYSDQGRLLVRVRFVGRDFVSVQVAAATAEQVIASGYAVGETINTQPTALAPLPTVT